MANINSNGSRHRRRLPHLHGAGPSSGLLSLLATIAASSSIVDGKPFISQRSPPQFLCPSIDYDSTIPPDSVLIYRPITSTESIPGPANPKRNIPDKYVQGTDGRWRKVEYTLYGSTVPQSPTPAIDEATPPTYNPPPPPTVSPSNEFIDTLPDGWQPTHKPSPRTSLIIGLSIGLALFICFFITGYMFWRKNKIRNFDEEQKVRKRRRDELYDDRENLIEKDARMKQKIWARATARWKSHARYSAQQRRGKRAGHRLAQAQSSSNLPSDGQALPTDSSSFLNEHSSRGLPESFHEVSFLPRVSPHPDRAILLPEIVTISTAAPYSPPAYRSQGARISSVNVSAADQSRTADHGPSVSRFNQSFTPSLHRPSSSDDHFPCVPPYDGAHIAIDDKGLLARLADLASAPPLDDSAVSGRAEPHDVQVSAPEWHDEELVDCIGSTHCRSLSSPISIHHTHSSAFPPPPSFKGIPTATALYNYSHSFEDLAAEHEPSGFPSAPPLEETDISPSAPPLADDDDWESDGVAQQNFSLEDHAQQPDFSRTSDTIPPVQGPVASNRTPPCYYP